MLASRRSPYIYRVTKSVLSLVEGEPQRNPGRRETLRFIGEVPALISRPCCSGPMVSDLHTEACRLCDVLAPQDLAEVLKWPFAVGEAETILLASLEKKTGQEFGGDVWRFVEQAESLGIKDIELQ
jgi:hypothetical protein